MRKALFVILGLTYTEWYAITINISEFELRFHFDIMQEYIYIYLDLSALSIII